jgi:anti-sigma regulatory factor (Ser/Thr protein kinase)
MDVDLRLPLRARSADAPAAARRFVVDALRRWSCDEDVTDDASIVATELVSNAVEHTGDARELRLVRTGGSVVIVVADASPEAPQLRTQDDPLAPRGRGLLLVQRLTARWGVRGTASGKVIWAELLAVPAPSVTV